MVYVNIACTKWIKINILIFLPRRRYEMVTQTATKPIVTREELERYLPNRLRRSGSEYRTAIEPSRSGTHLAINLEKQVYYDFLSKSIIAKFHLYFVAEGIDNYDHVMAIKIIITSKCSHFSNESIEVEKNLLDHALDLFREEWLRLAKEDEDEYDRKEELEEASRVFLQIYKTEKEIR